MKHGIRNWILILAGVAAAGIVASIILQAINIANQNATKPASSSSTSTPTATTTTTTTTTTTSSKTSLTTATTGLVTTRVASTGMINKYNPTIKLNFSPYIWRFPSANIYGSGYVDNKVSYINSTNSASSNLAWFAQLEGNVTSTPSLEADKIWVADDKGFIYCVNVKNGMLVWRKRLSDFTNVANSYTSSTPLLFSNSILVGDARSSYIIRLNKLSGDLIWKKQLDDHPDAAIRQSIIEYAGNMYIGLSLKEGVEETTFRGSLVSINANSGAQNFRFYTLPENKNKESKWYSGGSVIGRSIVLDSSLKAIYFATGNILTVPGTVANCLEFINDTTAGKNGCFPPGVYHNSLVGLDLKTGAYKTSFRSEAYDSWIQSCKTQSNCPSTPVPYNEFTQSPFTSENSVTCAQMTGVAWNYDTSLKLLRWGSQIGNGGYKSGAGISSATNGAYIVTTSVNKDKQPYVLVDGTTTTAGFWSLLDAATGEVIWQTPDPSGLPVYSSVLITNDIVVAPSLDEQGHIYLLDINSGRIRAIVRTGSPVLHNPLISGSVMIVGSGKYSGYVTSDTNALPGLSAFSFDAN